MSQSLELTSNKRVLLLSNLILLAATLIAEKFAIGSHIYGFVKESNSTLLSQLLFEHGKSISRSLVLGAFVFVILIQKDLATYKQAYIERYNHSSLYFLAAQALLFAIFYSITEAALAPHQANTAVQLTWLFIGAAIAITTILALASISFWTLLLKKHKYHLLASILISYGIWWLGVSTQSLWIYFSDITFYLVTHLLSLLEANIFLDTEQRLIGLNGFIVFIDTACSGYEGIGLVLAFVAIFLYSFREDFKFPRSLWLFPLGAFVIWVFNLLRIVVLILIGAHWSENVAVWGFHAQAGWITFILTSLGLMFLAYNSSFFTSNPQPKEKSASPPINLPVATLLPLIALLATTFITQAFSGQFDWLYPIRVITVAAVFIYCMKYLDLSPFKWSYTSIVAGLTVTVIWLALVENNTETNQLFKETLSDASPMAAGAWLLFRFLGATITVPIAEELGFRAYLLSKLSGQPVTTVGKIAFSIMGLVVSSIAFGLLHGAWIAGTLAGVVYAIVRYRSNHIGDAIIAHGVTNLSLFIYAAYSGQWSLI